MVHLDLLFSSVGLLFDLSMAYFILWVCYLDSLTITVDLLSDLLWHSSFSRFVVHLVHIPFFPAKQDFRGNWEFAFGLRRTLWSFQVVLMVPCQQMSRDSSAFSSNLIKKVTGGGKVLYRF